MPEVTILLTARVADPAMPATVRDLLGQTLTDLEVLVLTSGPEPLPADLPTDDPRLRIVPAEAESLGQVLNHGLALAQGRLIARAVPGDESMPDRLERQAGLLKTAGELAFVATAWRELGPDGHIARVVTPPPGDAALRLAMADGDAIGHPTAMMRRDAIVKAGGWRPAFVDVEDYDLLLRLMDRHPGACTREPMVDHTVVPVVLGWRSLEQRVLSEMAAVAAHDRRQAGRPDHGDRASPVDRDQLHRMGLVAEEITRTVVDRAFDLALATGSAGQWQAMREAARLGLRQEGLSGALKSKFLGLWLRSIAHLRPLPPKQEAPIA